MKNNNKMVTLMPLKDHEKEKFIKDIQTAFKKAVVEEFGNICEEVITREDIEQSFCAKGAESYNIIYEERIVGGVVIEIHPETNCNILSLLFINVDEHNKGIGVAAWQSIEQLHPETEVWETCTPYFEIRNIHFYVNKCGFHIVEFFNPHHPDLKFHEDNEPDKDRDGRGCFLKFEKRMK